MKVRGRWVLGSVGGRKLQENRDRGSRSLGLEGEALGDSKVLKVEGKERAKGTSLRGDREGKWNWSLLLVER